MAKIRPAKALKEVIRHLFIKPATRLYPFVKAELQHKFRGRITFEAEKCVGCKLCMKDCPANAVEITQIEPPKYLFAYRSAITGQSAKIAIPKAGKREFLCTINLARCIYCAQCVDSCPRKALSSSHEFELADFNSANLRKLCQRPKQGDR